MDEIDPNGKYYRATKESFLWKEGAILQLDEDEEYYLPITQAWNQVHANDENISVEIIENSPWFERVYPVAKKGGEVAFTNAEETREKFKFDFEPVKPR